MISAVILTLNEAENIGPCIQSLDWCDDIHVIDSGSSDNTAEIAASLGAHVHERAFVSYADQHNWPHEHAGLKHDWVLHIDADERSTPDFANEIIQKVQFAPESTLGFYCCWKLMLFETWLKWSDCYPRWQLRLIRKSHPPYIDFGHAQKEKPFNDDELDYVKAPYLHYAFNRGWARWYDRHNKYSTNEARERLTKKLVWKDLFSPHRSKRVFALKVLAHKMPLWPFIRFAYMYLLRFGFLEGKAGFIYCAEMAHYEMMIWVKMIELKYLNISPDKEYSHYAQK